MMPISTTTATAHRPHRVYPLPVASNRVKFARFFATPTSSALLSRARHPVPLHTMTVTSADASRWRTGASRWRTGASLSGEGVHRSPATDIPGQLSLDQILLVAEVLCFAPPAIFSVGRLMSSVFPGASKQFLVYLESTKVLAFQYFLLVGAVAIGSLIRWRQWRRIGRVNETGVGVNLIGRIGKVKEDLQSLATIIRVLSRKLEKLGIWFRVTRKTLKEPIAETAALAQKNSEATQVLAMQEDILEKELGEIQKILLAMQEQQQKQLELVLAIGKAGRLLDSKNDFQLEQGRTGTSSSPKRKEAKELELQSERHAGGDNDSLSTNPDLFL